MRAGREPSGGATLFARLSEVVHAVASGEISEAASLAARARFLSTFTHRRRRRSVAGAAWSGASIVAAGAAAHLFQPASTTAAPTIERRAPGNGYVSGEAGTSPTVSFAGGPIVDLAPDGRGRVGDLAATRARVVLEAGHASVRGAAHPGRDVLIVAGPYAVTSSGADFEVSWSGNAIEVRVESGEVTVAGPAVCEGLALFDGQSFVAHEAAWELRCF